VSADTLLLTGRENDAFATFVDLLHRQSHEANLQELIRESNDRDLLIDFSAAALEQGSDRSLLLAYEAADRAWRIRPSAAGGWNRALAAQRIGIYTFAERAWRDVHALESDPSWAKEAERRRSAAAQRAAALAPAAYELFFYRDVFERVLAGGVLKDILPEDHLASDTNAAIAILDDPARQRLKSAVMTYLRGRTAADANEIAVATEAYSAAEVALDRLHIPLALIARDMRLRCDCALLKSNCLSSMYAMQRDLTAMGRYPWLLACSDYGVGQTLYRQGHVYEAAQQFESALHDFGRLGDVSAAAHMHVLLTNVYSAGGESDLALRHFLVGLAYRSPDIVDRRRRILEDGITFMLRHGYLATAELLLTELSAAATTTAAQISRTTLEGVTAFRRGAPDGARLQFEKARTLLSSVSDESTRSDLQFRLAIAEAGSRMYAAAPVMADLDTAIAAHSGPQFSIWLPQLLTERGALFDKKRDSVRAEADYRRAIEILESREPRIDETVLALGIVSASESPFDRAIRLLLRQGRTTEALSIAERASALRISSLHARGAGVRDVFRRMRDHDDGISAAQSALNTAEIAVVQYLLDDQLITWLITPNAIRATRLSVRRADLVHAADRLRDCGRKTCDEAVASLSGALIRPWFDSIPRGNTLLLQPPSELESVPYAMLETRDGERVVQRNAIATEPKLLAFAHAEQQDALRTGEVSAFFAAAPTPGRDLPGLPRAAHEVTNAARAYPGAIVDADVTRGRFLQAAAETSIVHFAGHIVIDTLRPLFSALVFRNGERFYLHEMDRRSFRKARVIVLSACNGGRAGMPMMSVANALLSQDVPSVVYAFRPIDDSVAEAFAVAFHRALRSGASRAEAVRAAQLTLMHEHPEDPTVWGAFALAGTARRL
jgi:CHAT domain-containing protein